MPRKYSSEKSENIWEEKNASVWTHTDFFLLLFPKQYGTTTVPEHTWLRKDVHRLYGNCVCHLMSVTGHLQIFVSEKGPETSLHCTYFYMDLAKSSASAFTTLWIWTCLKLSEQLPCLWNGCNYLSDWFCCENLKINYIKLSTHE